jgi:hypothetical protein
LKVCTTIRQNIHLVTSKPLILSAGVLDRSGNIIAIFKKRLITTPNI